MAWWRDIAALAAAGLEGLALLAAIRGDEALALPAHVVACGGFALWKRGALVFVTSLFLPVLGPLGLAIATAFKGAPESSPGSNLIRTRISGSLEVSAAAASSFSAVTAQPASVRVAAARGRSDPACIALLRRALLDPDENVRLVAHAVLESKSRAAYRNIHEASRALEGAPRDRHAAIHQRLAEEHWELAWLGLAEGDCLDHVLNAARSHALAALDSDGARASLHFLLGRIELRRADGERAETALRRAIQLGFPAAAVRPYLAEAAFLARRFDRVRERLAGVATVGENAAVDRVRRYWT